MSRVCYAMMHDGGAVEMTRAVRDALDVAGRRARRTRRRRARPTSSSSPSSATRSCTTWSSASIPIPLGSAPFALATDAARPDDGPRAGAPRAPRRPRLRPAVHRRPRRRGHRRRRSWPRAAPRATRSRCSWTSGRTPRSCWATVHRLLAASSPTGPAFEGAQISGGQRAAPGRHRARPHRPRHPGAALPGHRRRAAGRTSRVRARPPAGPASPGSAARGSSRSIAELFLAGVVTADGVDRRRRWRRGRRGSSPTDAPSRYLSSTTGAGEADPARHPAITQNDVRAIQLAKAALYAGARLLMDHLGVDTVDEIRAGRRVRQPHRSAPRDGPRADPGLRPRTACATGRQRGRDRCADRAARRARARREIEARRPAGREDRDRGRAALPGALRGGDGHPAPDRADPVPVRGRRRCRRAAWPATVRAGDGRARGGQAMPTAPTADRNMDDESIDGAPRPPHGGTLMNEGPRHRTGGRAGRRRPAPAAHVERVPFLTRDPDAVRGPRRGGARAHRAQRRHDPRGGRHRVPRRPGRARACSARPAPTSTASASASRAACAARIVQATRAARLHPARAEPGANRPDRRSAHGPRPELRLAVRPRPRRRPPLRDDRGLPQLREAHLPEPEPPPLRRHGLRAGGPAGQQAPPGHGLRPHPVLRQAVHGLRDPPVAGRRTRSRWRGSLFGGRDYLERPHGHPQPDQRQLAAGLGLDDARRRPRLRRGEPGDAHHAVHPGRRDGAGDGRPASAAQTLAEALAGMAFVQLVRPGAPVVLGSFASRCRCSRARRRSAPRSPRSSCT